MDRNSNKMLIDASHPEETRVVVLRSGRVEEFDFESASRKLLRGNVYLAKVTRVEPSLQAAFVDYGGNRHGFLAFNEIHPDYYQIPVADREALKQEELEAEAAEEAEAEERQQRRQRRDRPRRRDERNGDRDGGNGREPWSADRESEPGPQHPSDGMSDAGDVGHVKHPAAQQGPNDQPHIERDPSGRAQPLAHGPVPTLTHDDRPSDSTRPEAPDDRHTYTHEADRPARIDEVRDSYHVEDAPEPVGNVEDHGVVEINGDGANGDADVIEEVSSEEDALEEVPERPRRQRRRQYKIQEVIKRRQIILVQIVKEERGNKGAALTTYISLAGRYTVLMPNTGRGGGISRKITQPQDRKRLKAIAEELDVAEGMGLIIRTAGAARTKQEVKRDYEYLLRLWESVRDLTLASTAPCLVYEEGNLIKRSIRDLYSKDIDGVVVSGEIAHREAKNFMSMLMPGHGDHVARYDGSEPLFTRYGIERQLNAFFSPYVNLRSGGYLVINQTEALVAVDVNSGKSTREFSIEETALNTNMEAAEEIARQLKLRDLAGLIVVDFIDMEEKRNNRSVERRLKDALRHDRARIQLGRISHFGLLEMSRQRLRTGMLEGSTSQCPHCQGTGIIRSVESVALAVLRGLEDNLMKQPSSLAAVTTAEVALYILNHKRHFINEMEHRHGIQITINSSDRMHGANFAIERTAGPVAPPQKSEARAAVSMDWAFDDEEGPRTDDRGDDDGGGDHRGPAVEAVAEDDEGFVESEVRRDERGDDTNRGADDDRQGRRKRRRRGRRGRDDGEPRQGGPQGSDSRERDEAAPHYRNGHGPGGDSPDVAERGEALEPALGQSRDQQPSYLEGEHRHQPLDANHPHVEADAANLGEPVEGREDREPGGDDEGRQRRGRRRGRRGGRGRGRDGHTGAALPGEGDQHAEGKQAQDEGGWGIAEIARPGADQPDGPPAAVASHWDGGFAPPLQPVLPPVPAQPRPVNRNGEIIRQPETQVAVAHVDPQPNVPAMPPAREPVSLASRVPIAENRAPLIEPVVLPPIPAQPRPRATPVPIAAVTPAPAAEEAAAIPHPAAAIVDDPSRPVRKGWWQRRFGSE